VRARDAFVVLCPAGTHLSGSDCVPCEEGTYNDRDGQESCTACPDSKSSSPAGSDNFDQCTLMTNKCRFAYDE